MSPSPSLSWGLQLCCVLHFSPSPWDFERKRDSWQAKHIKIGRIVSVVWNVYYPEPLRTTFNLWLLNAIVMVVTVWPINLFILVTLVTWHVTYIPYWCQSSRKMAASLRMKPQITSRDSVLKEDIQLMFGANECIPGDCQGNFSFSIFPLLCNRDIFYCRERYREILFALLLHNR